MEDCVAKWRISRLIDRFLIIRKWALSDPKFFSLKVSPELGAISRCLFLMQKPDLKNEISKKVGSRLKTHF